MADQAHTIDSGAVPTEKSELVKGLGLFSATMIVSGSMIGSGIFIVSADIAHQVKSPALLLAVWLASGVMTLIGALSYGELAAAMPRAGGQYVYLRESLGPLWGFLYGWTMLLVIQTATIAAVAIAFSKFTAIMMPWFSPTDWILKTRHLRSLAFLVRRSRPLQCRPQSPEPARHSVHHLRHLD